MMCTNTSSIPRALSPHVTYYYIISFYHHVDYYYVLLRFLFLHCYDIGDYTLLHWL